MNNRENMQQGGRDTGPVGAEKKTWWAKIKAVLEETLTLDEEARRVVLDRVCAGEPDVRREVERLLEAGAKIPPFIDTSAADYAAPIFAAVSIESEREQPADMSGQRVGAWRLVEEIGRGGMGVVYRAERTGGQFEQTVALKLVKRGMDSDAILQRFHTERRALASLQHPHIARLYDGDVTDEGTPWFAMEYVDGLPITEYCNANELSVDERLDLFHKVCRAVEHAHNHLIIHRDLKPSNILVTDDGGPHLLDFGLATILEDSSDEVPATRPDRRWLTLEYASPEQFTGKVIGTHSDTYQLGLILYEMLTGRRPYSVRGLSPTEAKRVICDINPPKPSTAVASDDGDAALQSNRLGRRLKGDLDTIILKALHKDPARGYATAESLANDIERHQKGLPVEARPDTLGYRAGKLIRRHPWRAGMTVLLVALTVGFFAFYMVRITAERDRAHLESEKSDEVTHFLVNLFEASDPSVAKGDTLAVRGLLERGAARIESLEDQPALHASLLGVLARIYANLGNPAQAEVYYRREAQAWAVLGANHEKKHKTALAGLGTTLVALGRRDEAEAVLRDVLASESLDETMRRTALLELYGILHGDGRRAEADSVFSLWETALATASTPVDAATAGQMAETAMVLGIRGQVRGDTEATRVGLELLDQALPVLRATHGERDPRYARALTQTSMLLNARAFWEPGETAGLAEFEEIARRAVTVHRTIYMDPHVDLASNLYYQSTVLRRLNRLEEAEVAIREAISVAEQVLGHDHVIPVNCSTELARVLAARGNYDEALALLEDVRGWWVRRHDAGYLYTLRTEMTMGLVLADGGRFDEAEQRLVAAYESLEATRGATDAHTQRAIVHLVDLYDAWGKPDQAAVYRALLEETDAE